MDGTEELDDEGIKKYQSLIGALQWAVSLSRFNIATAVMMMSKFCVAPRSGHLECVKRICRYLCKMKHACIRFRTDMPDYLVKAVPEYNWERTIYGDVHEDIPEDVPEALGKGVILMTFVDANLCHDMTTGRAITGILHMVNKTLMEWFSKKQPTIETATYGSEFMPTRVATEQVLDMRAYFRF